MVRNQDTGLNAAVGVLLIAGLPTFVALVLGVAFGIPLIIILLLMGAALLVPRPLVLRVLVLVAGASLAEVYLSTPRGFVVLLVLPFVLIYALPRFPRWAVLMPISLLIVWIETFRALTPHYIVYLVACCLVYPHLHIRGSLHLGWVLAPFLAMHRNASRIQNVLGMKIGVVMDGLSLESIVVDEQGHLAGSVLPSGVVLNAMTERIGATVACPSLDRCHSQPWDEAGQIGIVLDKANRLAGRVSQSGVVTNRDGNTIGQVDQARSATMLAGGAALLLLFCPVEIPDPPLSPRFNEVQPEY